MPIREFLTGEGAFDEIEIRSMSAALKSVAEHLRSRMMHRAKNE
jgi:hypothetical protein